MTNPSTDVVARMQQTVQSYGGFAREYDKLVDPHRPPHILEALWRGVEALPSGGTVLETAPAPVATRTSSNRSAWRSGARMRPKPSST